jgi:hypothetical protein
MSEYLMALLAVGTVVWFATEGIRSVLLKIAQSERAARWIPQRELMAIVLGPAAAVLAHEMELVPCGEEVVHIVGVGVFGLLCTMVAIVEKNALALLQGRLFSQAIAEGGGNVSTSK